MEGQQLFDERVTMKKVQGYRSQLDSDSSGNGSVGTYAEMVEEVEKVSEMLMQTQSQLWQSQDELKTFKNKTKILEATLEQKDHEINRLRKLNGELRDEDEELQHEIERLNREICDRDEGRARPELERRLRKAIDFLKKDLEAANQKHEQAREEIKKHQKEIEELKTSNKTLEVSSEERQSKALSADHQLSTCQKQLREATVGNADLVEEVAKLREELNRTKKIATQKDALIRKEVEHNVKEKIKLEVSKAVTTQVTERVTREVTAKMKAERETELKVLREQIRNIVKENAVLKSKVGGAEKAVSETVNLEKDVQALTYELTRYESMIHEVKSEHQRQISQLETDYRIQIQTVKEEAAKEKWAHGAEIRTQMTAEREREVLTFTQRIEALSKQTDRLLARAEKEKEAYGVLVKRRVTEEMQREINFLSEKLEARTKEAEELLRNATTDKEAYADQVRRAAEDEKRREISKYTYRLEAIVGEKDSLQKRIESFEEELAGLWKENENYVKQLKLTKSEIKALEDENFKQKRKCQNLSTLVNRYKQDADEAINELKNAKHLFREGLLKSEEQNIKLKEKLKRFEPFMTKSTEQYVETLRALEDSKQSLVDRMKIAEAENTQLTAENEALRQQLDMKRKTWNESGSKHWYNTIKSENFRLKDHIGSLERLLDDVKCEKSIPKDGVLAAMETENSKLKSRIQTMDVLFRKYREGFKQLGATSENEIDGLKEQLQSTNELLEQYSTHRNNATKELVRRRQMTEDALTVASEDDTVNLNSEIQAIERILEMFKMQADDPVEASEKSSILSMESASSDLREVERLKAEVDCLRSLLDSAKIDESSEPSTELQAVRWELDKVRDDKSELEKKVAEQGYVIEKYRIELSKASQDLENTRETLALEGETAQKLSRRVESLNLLLDTTEQNRAENTRVLARTHRRYEEVAEASRREIKRLNERIRDLEESLTQAEHDLSQTSEQCESVKQEYETRLRMAHEEITGWKKKVAAVEKDLRDHGQELTDKFEKSKAVYKEALIKSETETKRLKKQLEALAQANIDYAGESKVLEEMKTSLETEISVLRREKDDRVEKLEQLLRTSKDECKLLLKRMEDSERKFQAALLKSENERLNLQNALDDVKKTLLGHTSEESSLENSSRRGERQVALDMMVPLQEAMNTLVDDSDDDSTDDSSSRIVARLDNMLGRKKKRITWKDFEWDIDESTVATGLSQQQKAAPSHSPDEEPQSTSKPSTLKPHHASQKQEDFEDETQDDQSKDSGTVETAEPESSLVHTFEEAIRWDKKRPPLWSKGTSWDDSTTEPKKDVSREESYILSGRAERLQVKDIAISKQISKSTETAQVPPKVKKGVSWNLDDISPIGKSFTHEEETNDQQREDTVVERNEESAREPAVDFKSASSLATDEEIREEASGDDAGDSSTLQCHFDSTEKSQEIEDDDESSTIDWNIQQPEDLAISLSGSESSGHQYGLQGSHQITGRKEPLMKLETHWPNPTRSLMDQEESSDDDDENALYPAETVLQNSQAEGSSSSSSFSSSFSYSSNGSSAEGHEAGGEEVDADSLLAVAPRQLASPQKKEDDRDGIPFSIPTRRQKARDKSSRRRNWTKDDLNQFISGKRTRRRGMKGSFHMQEEQPYDEGTPKEPSTQVDEVRVVTEEAAIEAVQSNE